MSQVTSGDMIADLLPPIFIHKYSSDRALTETSSGQGGIQSYFYASGIPGPADLPTAGLSGETLNRNTPGVIPLPTPGSGAINLVNMDLVAAAQFSWVGLYDRLWHNNAIDLGITTVQTIDSVPFPPRDDDATINGRGCEIFLEFRSGTVAGSAGNGFCTLLYTDSNGVARTAKNTTNATVTFCKHTLMTFDMGGGNGVQSIQSIQFGNTAYSTMTAGLVVARSLAINMHTLPTVGSYNSFSREEIYDDSALFLVSFGVGADGLLRSCSGVITLTQG